MPKVLITTISCAWWLLCDLFIDFVGSTVFKIYQQIYRRQKKEGFVIILRPSGKIKFIS